MAIGLSPKFLQEISYAPQTPEQFLVLALEAARELGWNIGHVAENGFIAYTSFSMSSYSEEIKVKTEGGTATLKSECTGNQMMDWGKNKRNIEHFLLVYEKVKTQFSGEELSVKYEELKPNLVAHEEDILSQAPAATKERLGGILHIFKPSTGYFITPLLIDLNILIFILMIISGVNVFLPDNESLVRWGANFRPTTLEGGWWRLLTNCFIHIGILHLLMNMYALLYIGLLLEPYLEKTRFLAAYLMTGIVASLVSLSWHDLTISAGASGAIFGMYGVFLAMLTTNLIEASARKALLTSIAIFVGFNLVNGLKGGIDNAAHIGGLVSGILIGYAFCPGLKKQARIGMANGAYALIALLAVIVLVSSFVVYHKLPNDIGNFEKKMKRFAFLESQALEYYGLPENATKERRMDELKERGLYYWDENIKLLNDADKLNLPDILHKRIAILLNYSELRKKSYELLYHSLYEDTVKYKDQIEDLNTQIEAAIKELKATVGGK